jgi:hypothetical protein
MLQDGIAALKAGRKADAKRILTQIVDTQEDNEQAWLWLSACVDTPEEQQICLENVIAINPNNQKARKGLDAISKQISQKSTGIAVPTPPAPAPSPSQPAASDGNFFSGFDSTTFSSPSSGSSVEWGNPSAPAAYGSGKNVQLPSDEEYDNWVSSLNLGGSGTGSSPFTTGFDTNFENFEASPATSTFDSGDAFGSSSGSFDDPFGKSSFTFDKPAASMSGGSSAASTSAPDSFSSFDSGFSAPAASSSFDSFGSDTFAAAGGFDEADPFGSAGGSFGSPGASSRSDPFASTSSSSFSFDFGSDSGSPAISEESLADDPFGSSSFGSSGGGFRDDSAADLFSNLPHSGSKGSAAKAGGSSRSSSASVDDLFDDEQFSPPPTVDDLFEDDFGGGRFDADDEFAERSSGGFVFGKSTATARLGSQAYYKAIPEEIGAGGGFSLGKMDLKLALTVGGLGLLNAASLAALVLALSGR